LKYEFSAAVGITYVVFWDITPCGLVDSYRRFGGISCLQLQGKRMKTAVGCSPKDWYIWLHILEYCYLSNSYC